VERNSLSTTVYRFCLVLLQDPSVAQDVSVSVLATSRDEQGGTTESDELPALLAVARDACLRRQQKRARYPFLKTTKRPSRHPGPSTTPADGGLSDLLRVIATLRECDRVFLGLRSAALTHAVIGDLLGITAERAAEGVDEAFTALQRGLVPTWSGGVPIEERLLLAPLYRALPPAGRGLDHQVASRFSWCSPPRSTGALLATTGLAVLVGAVGYFVNQHEVATATKNPAPYKVTTLNVPGMACATERTSYSDGTSLRVDYRVRGCWLGPSAVWIAGEPIVTCTAYSDNGAHPCHQEYRSGVIAQNAFAVTGWANQPAEPGHMIYCRAGFHADGHHRSWCGQS
jgi:hypothetical protein